MLTAQDEKLIRQSFSQGPSALLEAGFDPDEIGAFLRRPEVRAQFAILNREFDQEAALAARTRFLARRQLSGLRDGAVAVLAQALAGPDYLMVMKDGERVIATDAKGMPILRRPEITPTQVRAAERIFDALGVGYQKAPNGGVAFSDGGVEALFDNAGDETQVVIEDDPEHTAEAQRALSRERVRTAIDLLARKVPGLHANVIEVVSGGAASKSSKKTARKRAPRKKASAKKARGKA